MGKCIEYKYINRLANGVPVTDRTGASHEVIIEVGGRDGVAVLLTATAQLHLSIPFHRTRQYCNSLLVLPACRPRVSDSLLDAGTFFFLSFY